MRGIGRPMVGMAHIGQEKNQVDSSEPEEEEEEEEYAWVSYFCSLKGNEFFCQVDDDYIHDGFNLMGLSSQIPYYEFALDIILDVDYDDENLTEEQQEMIESEAENLYGLIHARYILTSRGLAAMLEKYKAYQFGRCPRAPVKLYCAKCNDIYSPRSHRAENVDGAYFGTSFAHLFYLVYPELRPEPVTEPYIPRVFGFRLHSSWWEKSMQYRQEKDKVVMGPIASAPR
ncbi:unnamed protein product (mitochondrion) [Plasmodiophora brassicae]|uniref:Casein kinase II subunit beta n=1 Tax=Plasmodiophora brassicae TaxID=37360 RepID=A0A3P3Y072_PLABS|nr:unnamed protein product [Plasmodiophora brassicae]